MADYVGLQCIDIVEKLSYNHINDIYKGELIMKNTLKKLIAVILALTVISGCFVFSSSAVNSEYLTYTVKEDGTVELKKCSTKAEGAVVVPSVVTIKKKSYDVTSIGDSAFEKCSKVTSVSVSEGIKSIGARAFADCTALTDVYVPQTLSLCQYNAFSGCDKITVHCYSSNYQFFTVYGINTNISIKLIDGEESDSEGSGLSGTIVDLIRGIILAILNIFLKMFK